MKPRDPRAPTQPRDIGGGLHVARPQQGHQLEAVGRSALAIWMCATAASGLVSACRESSSEPAGDVGAHADAVADALPAGTWGGPPTPEVICANCLAEFNPCARHKGTPGADWTIYTAMQALGECGVNAEGAVLDGLNVEFVGQLVTFAGWRMWYVSLVGALLDDSMFPAAELYMAKFDGVSATNTDFRAAYLHQATFVDAQLCGADFRGATLWGTDFTGADLTCARFDGASVANVTCPSGGIGQSWRPPGAGEDPDDVPCPEFVAEPPVDRDECWHYCRTFKFAARSGKFEPERDEE